MVKYCFTCLLVFMLVKAQAQKRLELSLGSGINWVKSTDLAGSPLTYSGHGFPLKLETSLTGLKFSHSLSIEATSSYLTNAYPLSTSANTQTKEWHWFDISYSFLHLLKKTSNWEHSIGAIAQPSTFFRSYAHLDGYSWDSLNGFLAQYSIAFLHKKQRFEMGVQLPIISYLHRPGFTADEIFLEDLFSGNGIIKHGQWLLVGDGFWQYNLQLAYQKELSEKLSLRSTARMEQYEINFPQKSGATRFRCLVQIVYQVTR